MAYFCETVSLKGWSRGALAYLLALAENPMAPMRELCPKAGLVYRNGHTIRYYRRQYPGFQETEAELRASPEACAVFLARIHLPQVAKAMIDTAQSGKSAVAAAQFISGLSKGRGDGEAKGLPEWLDSLLKPERKSLPEPEGKVVDGEFTVKDYLDA